MKSNEELLREIFARLDGLDYVKPEQIPDIPLYMDQLTTFMDERLAKSKRYPEDKVLTKTMINNYAKNRLLPPPEKKKYSKEHLLLLIFIYYFKNILSINDIQSLLNPITDKYFKSEKGWNLEDIYREVFSMEKGQIEYLQKDLVKRYNVASETFQEAPEEDREFLQMFSFLCLLSFDVYVKKMLLEKILDDMQETREKKKSKNDDGKK